MVFRIDYQSMLSLVSQVALGDVCGAKGDVCGARFQLEHCAKGYGMCQKQIEEVWQECTAYVLYTAWSSTCTPKAAAPVALHLGPQLCMLSTAIGLTCLTAAQWLSNYDLCSACHAKPEAAEKAPYAEVYKTTLRGALQGLLSKTLACTSGIGVQHH